MATESCGGWVASPFLSSGCTGSLSKARCSQALPQQAAGHKGPPRCCWAAGALGQRGSPQAVSPFQDGPLQALQHPTPSQTVSNVRPYLDCAQRQRPRGRTSLLHTGPLGSSGQPGSRTIQLGMAGSPPATWPQGGPGESLCAGTHTVAAGGRPRGRRLVVVALRFQTRSCSAHSASQTGDWEAPWPPGHLVCAAQLRCVSPPVSVARHLSLSLCLCHPPLPVQASHRVPGPSPYTTPFVTPPTSPTLCGPRRDNALREQSGGFFWLLPREPR